MTISTTPRRNAAVVGLWRTYHGHKREAAQSQAWLDGMNDERKRHAATIDTHDRCAMECLDILSQIGEDVSHIPPLDYVEREGRDEA